MDMRTLLTNFELLAHAPGGVAALREIVLDLAVAGRLVQQDCSDEPAPAFLARLGIDAAPGTSGDVPLPRGWCAMQLGQLGEFRGGGTPPKNDPKYWGGGIPWVSPKDMKRLRVGESIDTVTRLAIDDTVIKLIPANSLLMVTRGMILAHSFPVAITTAEVTLNQDMKALVPVDPSLAEYLLLALRAAKGEVLGCVERSTHGTCRLDSAILRGLTVRLPPPAEQRRIVARVAELMASCDDLEERQEHRRMVCRAASSAALDALANAETPDDLARSWSRLKKHWSELTVDPDGVAPLRQAILQLAVQGRLVARAPVDHPTPVSSDAARALWGASLPPSWSAVLLVDLLREPLANGRSVPDGSGFPVLRLSALRGDRIAFSDHKLGDWDADRAAPFVVQRDDFLVVRGNGARHLVGRGCLANAPPYPVAYPDTAIRVRVRTDVLLTAFLSLVWNTRSVRTQLERRARTTAGIYKISQNDVEDVAIALPPISAQHRIVVEVNRLSKLCDELERNTRVVAETATQFATAAVARLPSAAPEGSRPRRNSIVSPKRR